MAATYPSGVRAIMTRGALMSDATTQGDFVDNLQFEVRAIESTVGVNPQGAFATVSARIAAREPVIANYTPTLGGTGWALGASGTASGRYVSVDGTCMFVATLTFGGAGMTFGASANATVSLPVNAHSSESGSRHIHCTLTDATGPSFFRGTGQIGGTLTGVNILAWSASGANVNDTATSSTVPYTWATGDSITVHGSYITA